MSTRQNLIESKQKSASPSSHRRSLDLKTNETMVKDLDRPSSEMNIQHSNALRNSFILEEDEEEIDEETTTTQLTPHDEETDDKTFDLPFPELVFINLADNQVNFFFFYCFFNVANKFII